MKGTGCRRLFVKNDLRTLPHSPKYLFFISFSRFTVGSRARNLGEISLSRFIYSLPDVPKLLKHLAPGEFAVFVYLYFVCFAHPLIPIKHIKISCFKGLLHSVFTVGLSLYGENHLQSSLQPFAVLFRK